MDTTEYNDLLNRAVEKLNTINVNSYPENEIRIPVQRVTRAQYKEASICDTFDTDSFIIFTYRKKTWGRGFSAWELVGDNLTK